MFLCGHSFVAQISETVFIPPFIRSFIDSDLNFNSYSLVLLPGEYYAHITQNIPVRKL